MPPERDIPTSLLSLQSSISKLEGFLSSPCSILLLTGPPGVGKSTMVKSVSREKKWDVVDYMGDEVGHFESFCEDGSSGLGVLDVASGGSGGRKGLGGRKGGSKHDRDGHPSSLRASAFHSHSHSHSQGNSGGSSAARTLRRRLLLVHQLPCPSPSDPSNSRVHTALVDFTKGRGKMVIIHSFSGETGLGPKDLDTLIGSVPCQVVHCNKVGLRIMRRIVGGLVEKARVNEIVQEADGDVRQAVIIASMGGGGGRDEKLGHFHALGKLLYCKRDANGELQDDLEAVVGRCTMSQEGLLAFLQFHSVSFFVDISELASALSCYSDCELFEGQVYKGLSDMCYPRGYSQSFMSRAVSVNCKEKVKTHKFTGESGKLAGGPVVQPANA